MAGLGRKDFQAGAVLSAADVDGYLMDQTVMKFANTAAAGSAYGTAIAEGMHFYLSDTDETVFYTGSAFSKQGSSDVAGKNKIINGGFDFWQRGTSFSNPSFGTYTTDRWFASVDGTGYTRSLSQQTFTPGSAPAGYESQFFARWAVTALGTGATANNIINPIEDVRTFAGQTVTLSFFAKSAVGALYSPPGLVQNFGSGGSGQVAVGGSSFTTTTSWQRFSFTLNVPSISGKTIGTGSALQVVIAGINGSTFTLDIWGVQLEAGSVATPFSRAGGTLQGELAACQRYYWRTTAVGAYTVWGVGPAENSTQVKGVIHMPVTMRTTPSAIEWTGTASNYAVVNQSFITCNGSISIDGSYSNQNSITAVFPASVTGGTFYRICANNNTSAYLGFSAEL